MNEKLQQLVDQFNGGVPKDEVVIKSQENLWPDRIKNIRAALGKTQQQLANQLSTTAKTVSRWESGKSKPSRHHITLLKTLEKAQNHP